MHATDKYFEFWVKNNVLNSKNEVEIEVLYNFEGVSDSRFRVKPVSSKNFPKIWDVNKEVWVFSNSLWSDLPRLSKDMKIKFDNADFLNIDLHLQVQDTQTAKIYETSKQKIWSRNWFVEYLGNINEGLFKMIE